MAALRQTRYWMVLHPMTWWWWLFSGSKSWIRSRTTEL